MAYEPTDMSQAQIEAFLQAPRFAVIGTNRVDGPPQLTPVWYIFEGGQLFFMMGEKSAKFRNLSRDPRIGVCITGDAPDARSVMLYGTVELAPEGDARVDDIIWRIVRRYCDSDEEALSYTQPQGVEEQTVLGEVTPKSVIAQDYN